MTIVILVLMIEMSIVGMNVNGRRWTVTDVSWMLQLVGWKEEQVHLVETCDPG